MRKKLGEILVASGAVTSADIAAALSDQSAGEPSRLGDLLIALGRISPAQLARALSEQYGVPYTDLPPVPSKILEAVPIDFQRMHRLVPFKVAGKELSVALADLTDLEAVSVLRREWTKVNVFVAPGDEIDAIHAAAAGMFHSELPPLDLPSVAPAIAPLGGVSRPTPAPTAEDLFGSFELDAPPAATTASEAGIDELFAQLDKPSPVPAPPPATPATPSGMFDLTPHVAGAPSGTFAPPASPSGMFELAPQGGTDADEPTFDLSDELAEPEPPPAVAPLAPSRAKPRPADDEVSFFEAAPQPIEKPVSPPPPSVTPVAISEEPRTEATTLPPGLFDTDKSSSPAPAAKPPAPAKPPPAAKPPAKPAAKPASSPPAPPLKPPAASPPAPAAKPPPSRPSAPKPIASPPAPAPTPRPPPPAPQAKPDLELPDWLSTGSSSPPSASAATIADEDSGWTGALDHLAPSKLAVAVAKALVRRRVLTEQDILDELEKKK